MAKSTKAKAPESPVQDESQSSRKIRKNGLSTSLRQDQEAEKDAEELRLEKIIFGDDAGFKKALAAHSDEESEIAPAGSDLDAIDSDTAEQYYGETDIAKIADADVSSNSIAGSG